MRPWCKGCRCCGLHAALTSARALDWSGDSHSNRAKKQKLPGHHSSWHSNQSETYQHRWKQGAVANRVAESVSEGQLPPHHQRWWKHTITVMKCQGGHGSEPLVVTENNVCSIGCAARVCQHVKWGNKSKCFTQRETKGTPAGTLTQTGNYYAKTNEFLFLTTCFCAHNGFLPGY